MERRQEAGFLSLICSKITRTKEKEISKRKSDEEERSRREKSMVALFMFTMATLAEKKLLDTKSPIGGNVFKISARCVTLKIFLKNAV